MVVIFIVPALQPDLFKEFNYNLQKYPTDNTEAMGTYAMNVALVPFASVLSIVHIHKFKCKLRTLQILTLEFKRVCQVLL